MTATNQYGTDTQEYVVVIRERTVIPTTDPIDPIDPTDPTGPPRGGGSASGGSASLAVTGGTAAFAAYAAGAGALLIVVGSGYLLFTRSRRRV